MSIRYVALKPLHWGLPPQAVEGRRPRANRRRLGCLLAALAVTAPAIAFADPPHVDPITVPPASFSPSWDLDGTYLWLGPIGAASRIDARWDSTFGADAALVVVREREPISVAGVDLGASRWTARGGGRVWVDGLIGTHLAGRMVGASLGPIVELSDLAHPRLGASLGVWGFAGITPFARVGGVAEMGIFAEIGIHIALPVLRR
jgi:hypothetical protein